MKPDEFEKQLQQQSIRRVPTPWREQILFRAREAAASAQSAKPKLEPAPWPTWFHVLQARLSLLLWPSPKAWGALAAVWLVIAVLNFSTSGSGVRNATYSNSSQIRLALKEQQKALAELTGEHQAEASNQPQPVKPGPRSEAPVNPNRCS